MVSALQLYSAWLVLKGERLKRAAVSLLESLASLALEVNCWRSKAENAMTMGISILAGQQTRGSLGELLGLLGCWSHCPSGIISAISSGWSLHFSGTWADELLDGFGTPFKNQGD